jgi:hypothetical protein
MIVEKDEKVLILADVRDSFKSAGFMTRLKETEKQIKPMTQKQAIFGINGPERYSALKGDPVRAMIDKDN